MGAWHLAQAQREGGECLAIYGQVDLVVGKCLEADVLEVEDHVDGNRLHLLAHARIDLPLHLAEHGQAIRIDQFQLDPMDPLLRITSYNVCYTKLLRFDQIYAAKMPVVHPSCAIALRMRFDKMEEGVITSYSIHYTKLYDYPYVLKLQGVRLAWFHWVALAASLLFMGYAEGYKGFQLRFSPRAAARALYSYNFV